MKSIKVLVSLVLLVAAVVIVAARSDAGAVVDAMGNLSAAVLGWVAGALVLGALLASLRLWWIARDIGYAISFRDAIAALSVGQLAGGLFLQIVGQLMARGALLARRGLPVAVTLVMTTYERLVALAVSVALAAVGGWFLFGKISLELETGGAQFLKLAIAVLIAVAIGASLTWGRQVMERMLPALSGRHVHLALRSLGVSVAIQLATMAAYVVAAKSLAPALPLADLTAAAAIVMFAASLPISLAGWGVRELSAVVALGAVGLPTGDAFVVALLIGVVSLVAVGLLAALSLPSWSAAGTADAAVAEARPAFSVDYTRIAAFVIPLAAATAVAFQVHVPMERGALNINLADPFALIGGALFLLLCVRDRAWPRWRLQGFNAHVIAATAAVAGAFLIGWMSFGWSDWAFFNRLLGWLVLLAYGATGALLIARADSDGIRLLLGTFAAACVAIAGVDILLLAARGFGAAVSFDLVGPQIAGFAANKNAFAFQLILASLAILAVIRRTGLAVALLAVVLLGIALTGSRAGLGSAAVVLAGAAALIPDAWRRIAWALTLAAAAFVLIFLIPYSGAIGPLATGTAASDSERLSSIAEGAELFFAHPWFGAGLGAFVESYAQKTGVFLVIHSTPVWLLAEFGVIGTLVIAAPVVRILWQEAPRWARNDRAGIVLVLAITAFAVISLAHEMLYQRALWLIVGAMLAALPRPR